MLDSFATGIGEPDQPAAFVVSTNVFHDPQFGQLANGTGDARLADPDRVCQLTNRHRATAQRRQHDHVRRLKRQPGIGNGLHGASLHSLTQPLQTAAQKQRTHIGNYITHRIFHI